jgi:hypothetical protein
MSRAAELVACSRDVLQARNENTDRAFQSLAAKGVCAEA